MQIGDTIKFNSRTLRRISLVPLEFYFNDPRKATILSYSAETDTWKIHIPDAEGQLNLLIKIHKANNQEFAKTLGIKNLDRFIPNRREPGVIGLTTELLELVCGPV